MDAADLGVVAGYLLLVLWLGHRVSRTQHSVRDYFLTGRTVPWWAVMASIVATETSTVTVISVPGYAFGGNLTFLQIALGYLVGRMAVALVLIPPFFRGERLTAYELITTRFGRGLGRAVAALFLVTRNVSDGLRLFATGLVLAAALATVSTTAILPTGATDPLLVVAGIGLLAAVTLVYTWLGGMAAVVWLDVTQLAVYLGGAVATAALLGEAVPGGWSGAWTAAAAAGKLTLFDFGLDLTRDYTFWSAVVGGAFFTAATHGTDQMFVQRYLCCRSVGDARRALVVSGIVVLAQFALFLGIGILLWAYYTAQAPDAVAAGAFPGDRVLPHFMMTVLPSGLRGLMLAAVVAAAMSTLSSSLNSSAASVVGDFYLGAPGRGPSDDAALRVSRRATAACAAVQVAVAVAAIELSQRVIDDVLSVQFFTGGLMLGIFLLGVVVRSPTTAGGLTGLAAGLLSVVLLSLLSDLSWQWYALVGSVMTLGAGALASRPDRAPEGPR